MFQEDKYLCDFLSTDAGKKINWVKSQAKIGEYFIFLWTKGNTRNRNKRRWVQTWSEILALADEVFDEF